MSNLPLYDRVLVKRLPAEEKTARGIIIPDNAKEKPTKGEIIEIGQGARDDKGNFIPMSVKKGDLVLFDKWAGKEVNLDGEDLIVIKESEILIILEKKSNAKAA